MTDEEQLRQALVDALRRELVGPKWPPSDSAEHAPAPDVLQESPVQRYSAGVLFPCRQPLIEIEDVDVSTEMAAADDGADPEIYPEEPSADSDVEGRGSDRISDAYDETVRLANEFLPSAIGLSFIADVPDNGLLIRIRAAVYRSQKPADLESKLREWHRTALKLQPIRLLIPRGTKSGIKRFDVAEHLCLRVIYHRRNDGAYLVTVSLLNSLPPRGDDFPSGADCFFQVEFDVTGTDGRFVFKEYRTVTRSMKDSEEAGLELLYRNRKAYAAGHGCTAEWGDEHADRTNLVATSTIPSFKVAPVEPRVEGGNELSMYFLSGAEGAVASGQVPIVLENLARDYEAWIRARETESGSLPEHLREAAVATIASCRDCASRIRGGIDLLRNDEQALTAFMLANRAILMQQHHSRRPRRGIDQDWKELPKSYEPEAREAGRWRTFQLAFILMNIRSLIPLADGNDHAERNLVDLIWFPTGGGKTEAYLGLAAFDIFFRRLKKPFNAGCTVLMRYTLRLLTSQQFQRASSMICACELLRRQDPVKLGTAPVTIGLWVGESLTPTRRVDAVKAVNDLANKQKQAENPFQLLRCPWCGTELDNRDILGYVPHGIPRTVIIVCPDTRCPFSTRPDRLPVFVVDEDIYESPPTLLIGTVDKFAMLAWRAEAGSIFGLGTSFDPPELIIQDELHLISGPLGSVVGLYESAIDLLCSWRGRAPKIVASTATIRRAPQQCHALYDRPTFQFPPQATDISDSFFAVENPTAPGRVYVGVFASASPSFVTAMVRTLSSLFQSCKSLPLPPGANENVRDPYWTILQYFNSLRELGHAATLVEADIPEYMWAIASRDHVPKQFCRRLGSPVELTSRRTADEIPEILERLTVRYPKVAKDDARPLDTLLATNMISVGVDVDRLGLMVVVGQPKTTSEYIQASSRVGRTAKAPGLVVAMYNPGKPRDRSHYEHFRAYHAAFYKYVEPTSVTPYSIPVIERALHAILVVLARHMAAVQTPEKLEPSSAAIQDIVSKVEARCRSIDPEHAPILLAKLHALIRQWDAVRPSQWGRFGKPPESRPLMYPAGTEPRPEWDESAWPTPSSMRNVDVECQAQIVSTYESPT